MKTDPTALIIDTAVIRSGYAGKKSDWYKSVGICPQTFSRRRENPALLTLGELRRIIRASPLTDSEIVQIVRGKT